MNSIFPTFLFRYFELCVIKRNSETQNCLQKSVFTRVASNFSNLLEQKKDFAKEKISSEHQHGRALLCPGTLTWRT